MADANPFDTEGFIHETMPEQVHLIRQEIPDWFALAKDTNLTLMRVLMSAMSAGKPTSMSPQAVAVRLLIRSCDALQGVIVLSERGMIAEGRMLVRSIVENAICLAALVNGPDEIIKILKDDSEASRARQGKFIVAEKLIHDDAAREKLIETIDSIGKVQGLNVRNMAAKGPLLGLYLTYLRLSDDSGHSSARALDRYVHRYPDGTWQYKLGPGTSEAIAATLFHGLMAAIAVGVGITEFIEATREGSNFGELSARLTAMPAVPIV